MLDSKPTIETLLDHRSIRKFTGEPIAPEMLTAILDAGRAVSTSSYLQAVSVVRITDAELRTAFRQISCNMKDDEYNAALADGKRLGHGYVESCAEYLVFCMDSARHHQLSDTVQTDWTEATLIGTIDAALFAQNVMAAAESLGLGGVYIGSLRNDIERAHELMKLPKHVVPLFGLCLGHPDMSHPMNQGQRPRLPLDVLVSENTYQPASDEALAAYNEEVRAYYQARGNDMDWRDQINNVFGGKLRPQILDYLKRQGFCLR